MKKIFLGLFLIFGLAIGFLNLDFKAGEPTGTTQVEYTYVLNLNGSQGTPVNLTTNYGTSVSFDRGTQENYEFVGYINQGKLISTLDQAISIRVTENTYVQYYFKPAGEVAVIFMDTNLNFQTIRYTDNDGETPTNKMVYNETYPLPLYTNFSKPGLSSTGWTSDGLTAIDFSTATFTSDTIVYPLYSTAVNNLTLSITDGTASVTGPYTFNQVLTVTANGTGTFKYWLKDGRIASLDETYTFTIAKAHELEAVYDTDFVANTGSFVGISDVYDNLRSGYYTVIGNIDLATGEELVEWGIITSDLPGGITLDTPGVVKYNSSKLNSGTNEFVMSFAIDSEVPNYRAFVTTINGTTVKTTYSYYQETENIYQYASDLIISEYGEGGGSNKWVEIYNGTGSSVGLSSYSVELYSNGASEASNSVILSGMLSSGDVFVIYNSEGTYDLNSVTNKLINNLVANFNGDDAVVLKKSGNVIDAIGQIGFDPGSAWVANGVSTVNMTLVRMPSITSGDSNGSDVFDPSAEWIAYSQDTFTYIGSHTMTLPSDTIVQIITNSNSPSEINITGDNSVNSNETIQLSSDVEDVIWHSTNENILTVDETGLVTGVAEGSATVYAYSYYNHSVYASHAVTVSEIQEYTVSFNSLGGSAVSSQVITGGEYATEPADPTYTNNIFDGWYTSSDNGTTLDTLFNFSTTSITAHITLYAKWIDISSALTVTEVWDAGFSSTNTVFTDLDLIGVVAAKTDKGYIIQDTTTTEMISVHDITNIVSIGDKVFLRGQYNVSYSIARILNVSLFRTLAVNETINYDTTYAETINFASYNQVDYIGKLVKIEAPWVNSPTTSTNYTKFAHNETGLTTEMYSGNYIGILNSAVESNIIGQLAEIFTGGTTNTFYPQYDVYMFFYDSSSTYQKAIIIGDQHIVQVTTYSVTFEENGGSTVDDAIVRENGIVNEPEEPTKIGYNFDAWYTDTDFQNLFNFSSPISSSTILYAKWIPVTTYTVSFVDNGANEPVDSQIINEGGYATEPTVSKTGYSLLGWFTSEDGGQTLSTNPFDFSNTAITGDITLYADWEVAVSSGSLMIYEVYGGGGNSGATYKNDYIVLYNSTSSQINLDGYSIQYTSATGTMWSNRLNLSGIIYANGYYLISLAGGTVGATLPTANITGTINMSATAGKVALVSSTTALSGANPISDPNVVDFVGFGTANAYEGSGPAPAGSNITSIQRKTFIDSDDNKIDFQTVTPNLSYLN